MKFLPERTLYSILLVIILVVILAVLAILQYRWSGQISKAENERMHSSLLTSMEQFRRQFHNELQDLGFLVRPDASILARRDWKSYALSCSALFTNAGFHLIRNIYIWAPENSETSQLLKLDRKSQSFEAASWPPNMEAIRERYARFFSSSFPLDPSIRPFSWTVFHRIPMMVQPLISMASSANQPGTGIQFSGFVLLELNPETIYKETFPELAQKYFRGPEGYIYQVGVVEGQKPRDLLFQSDPSLTLESFASYDARISLLERNRDRFEPMPPPMDPGMRPSDSGNFRPFNDRGPQPLSDRDLPAAGQRSNGEGGARERGAQESNAESPAPLLRLIRPEPAFGGRPRLLGPIQLGDGGPGWELLAKHREGSLEAAVARVRRRNLAVSFGSLLLLAVSMALILVSARRAQRLARLQLDFVAGISHELRTPLAVICAAGDNLADGVLETSSRSAAEYGNLILNQGRKLSGMVEQILQFASMQRGTRPNGLRFEDLNTIVESALEQMQPAFAPEGFSVEKNLQPGLPRVRVDKIAVARCVQNLIQNALKYSGESRWIAIQTTTASAERGPEVHFNVEDRGMGIASEDLPHIFEPFYRGVAAAAAQIHGTGLGLFLARESLIPMQGEISVKSAPGKGSLFTVRFPSFPDSETPSAAHKG